MHNSQHDHNTHVKCRCCGKPIRIVPWNFGGRKLDMLTCDNTRCGLEGFTFTARDYAQTDLTPYRR
jgi:hypothetical protein